MKQNFSHKLEIQKAKLQQKKIDAKKVIQVAIIKLRKTQKLKKAQKNILDIQNYFRANKNKILYQNKKDKIKIIQSLYQTHQMKNKINSINQNIYTLQNSLRIINARKSIEKHKTILLCLTINFKLYLTKLKNIHKKRMNKIAKYIIDQAKERIVYNEYNNLWNKLNPFFIKFLTTKRHKEKVNKAKRRVMEEKFNKCMKIFQFNLLIK